MRVFNGSSDPQKRRCDCEGLRRSLAAGGCVWIPVCARVCECVQACASVCMLYIYVSVYVCMLYICIVNLFVSGWVSRCMYLVYVYIYRERNASVTRIRISPAAVFL